MVPKDIWFRPISDCQARPSYDPNLRYSKHVYSLRKRWNSLPQPVFYSPSCIDASMSTMILFQLFPRFSSGFGTQKKRTQSKTSYINIQSGARIVSIFSGSVEVQRGMCKWNLICNSISYSRMVSPPRWHFRNTTPNFLILYGNQTRKHPVSLDFVILMQKGHRTFPSKTEIFRDTDLWRFPIRIFPIESMRME